MIILYITLLILVIIIITILIMNNRSCYYKYHETFYYDKRLFNTSKEVVNTVNITSDQSGNPQVTNYYYTNSIYNTLNDDKQLVAYKSGYDQVKPMNDVFLHVHYSSLFFNDDEKSAIRYEINYVGTNTPYIPQGTYTSSIITGSGRYKNITGILQLDVDSSNFRKITIRYNYI